ncbi:MAG: FkbM family methyltransferase [Planctomycetaceae bacterium]|jgi:FkbM family methyltransferase|nr:FkbM family methyltransferase [Planctomycetaceae bacterium]
MKKIIVSLLNKIVPRVMNDAELLDHVLGIAYKNMHLAEKIGRNAFSIACREFYKTNLDHPSYVSVDPQATFPRRFIEYLFENQNRLSSLKEELFQGTDELSQAVIHRFSSIYETVLNFEHSRLNAAVTESKEPEPLLIPIRWVLSSLEQEEELRLKQKYQNVTIPDYDFAGKFSYQQIDYASRFGWDYVDSSCRNLAGKDVIDGGAHIGDTALVFSELQPKSIHSFEPTPQTFELLKSVIRKNGKEGIIVPNQKALGKESGRLQFYFNNNQEDTAASVFPDEQRQICEVECTTIDNYVQKHSLNVGLIKLDIEGAEFDAVLGATETIRQFKPALIIGLYHAPKDFYEIKPYLAQLGLEYQFLFRQVPYSYAGINARIKLIAFSKPK